MTLKIKFIYLNISYIHFSTFSVTTLYISTKTCICILRDEKLNTDSCTEDNTKLFKLHFTDTHTTEKNKKYDVKGI